MFGGKYKYVANEASGVGSGSDCVDAVCWTKVDELSWSARARHEEEDHPSRVPLVTQSGKV